MEDVTTYHIRIQGRAAAEDLAGSGPQLLMVEQAGPDDTLLSVRTDQAGLVGLIRHLHGQGYRFLLIEAIVVSPKL